MLSDRRSRSEEDVIRQEKYIVGGCYQTGEVDQMRMLSDKRSRSFGECYQIGKYIIWRMLSDRKGKSLDGIIRKEQRSIGGCY